MGGCDAYFGCADAGIVTVAIARATPIQAAVQFITILLVRERRAMKEDYRPGE
jgi:hypothetical protein